MKTHIIRLESHDDATSIRDKMSWSRAPRILLAFPKRRIPDLSPVDLNLLARQAVRLGGQLGLVTRDRAMVEYARDLGIPVFTSIPQAQRLSWLLPRRKRFLARESRRRDVNARKVDYHPTQVRNLPWLVRLTFFVVGLAGVFSLILFFIPSAKISVTPQRLVQELTLKLWANPDIPAALASGGMPARMETIIVEGSADGEASSTVSIPENSAEGEVTFTNLTESQVFIPAGTVLATSGDPPERFITVVPLTVPAEVGSTVEGKIISHTPGSHGNIGANAINAIEGAVGLSVAVTNPEPITGGSDRMVQAAREQDFEQLYDSLYTSLSETALQKMGESIRESGTIVRSSLKVNKIIQEKREPAAGAPAEKIHIDLRIEFTALSIQHRDIESVARLALDAGMPDGYKDAADGIKFTNLTDPILDSGDNIRWEVQAVRAIEPNLDAPSILRRIAGQPVDHVDSMIASEIKLQEQPEITMIPSWWRRMPYIPFRIEMVVE